MTFKEFIIEKFPLYGQTGFEGIFVSWGEVFKLHDEWLKDNQPILTVEVHGKHRCKNCGIEIDEIGYCSNLCAHEDQNF
jgi:hypothetical protein